MTRYEAVPRFTSSFDGVETQHCLSAGAHYDPDHRAIGPVIGCDVHTVQPGGGFDWHGHRGVVIVSRILRGTLRHEDDGGRVRHVLAGRDLLVQATGDGIRHAETNGGADVLQFVQLTLLLDASRSVSLRTPPFEIGGLVIDYGDAGEFVHRPGGDSPPLSVRLPGQSGC